MSQFASTLYPQTNPSNPILLDFRINPYRKSMIQRVNDWIYYLDTPILWRYKGYSVSHVYHARRVLARLAALSG